MRFASWMSVTSLTLSALGAQATLWRRVTVFPLSHPLWWATTGTVLFVWLFVGLALLGALRARPALTFFVAQAPGVMLMAGGLAGRFSFPRTDGSFFGAPFAVGVLWLVTTYRSYRALTRERRLMLLATSLLFAPLGARALYLGSTLYRIHGTNEPWTIGGDVSSGCIRMVNDDVIDLYERVKIGAKVIVL